MTDGTIDEPRDGVSPLRSDWRRPRGFGRRVFLVAVLVTALLSAFGMWSLRRNESQNRREARRGVERTAVLAAALGQSLVTSAEQTLIVAAGDASFRRGDVAGIDSYLRSNNAAFSSFTGGIFWIDPTGVVRAQVGPGVASSTTTELADRTYFKEAMAGKPAISPALRSKVDESPVVVFAAPTRDMSGKVNGVVGGSVRLDVITPDLLRSLLGTSALTVLDRDDQLIFGRPLDAENLSNILASIGGRDDGTVSDVENDEGAPAVVAFARVSGADWLILVERSEDELYATTNSQTTSAIQLLVLLAAVSLIAAAWVGWRLDRAHRDMLRERMLLDSILRQLPVAAVVADRSGLVMMRNRQAEILLGDDDPFVLLAPLSSALEKGGSANRVHVETDEAEPRRFIVSAAPVISGGRIRGATAVFEDITVQYRRDVEAEALGAVAASLVAVDDPARIARLLVDPGAVGVGATAAVVLLRDESDPNHLATSAATGPPTAREPWVVTSLSINHPACDAIHSGQAIMLTLPEVTRRYPEWASTFEMAGQASWAALPLQSGGHAVGVLGLGFTSADAVTGTNVPKLLGFAAQAGQALGRAARQRVEHDAALLLQRSLLDPVERDNPTLQFACRYLPGSDHLEVGGDFFDVIATGPDSVLLVIGDVVGHGLAAASAMSQIRSAVRALVATTDEPAKLLSLLDEFVGIVPACRVATAALVRVDFDRGRIVYSLAGHPPPQLRRADHTVLSLDGPPDPPLGVGVAPRRQQSIELASGSCALVMFTDGLVERRGEPIDLRIDRVARLLRATATTDPHALIESILASVADEDHQRDDIALMCVGFEIGAIGRSVESAAASIDEADVADERAVDPPPSEPHDRERV